MIEFKKKIVIRSSIDKLHYFSYILDQSITTNCIRFDVKKKKKRLFFPLLKPILYCPKERRNYYRGNELGSMRENQIVGSSLRTDKGIRTNFSL